MLYTTPPKGLPQKCINLKAAYLPATRWWCSFCKHTGGRCCYLVCLIIGKTDKTHGRR